jgi:hypothetical protein
VLIALKSGNINLVKSLGPALVYTGIALHPWKVIISLETNITERREFEPVQVGLINLYPTNVEYWARS